MGKPEGSMTRFLITRTRNWSDEKPCEEAVRQSYTHTEEWFLFRANKYPNEWQQTGTNHRTEGDMAVKEVADSDWFVEIDTLEALLAFRQKHGPIILDEREDRLSPLPTIEIYDGYRE